MPIIVDYVDAKKANEELMKNFTFDARNGSTSWNQDRSWFQ